MKQSIETLKSYYETGDKPTEQQFADLIDSLAMPMIGEIKTVSFATVPSGWAKCDGQLLNISDYGVLFNLIGTTYGGDGTTTFALPDLRGRSPIHIGNGPGLSAINLGQSDGAETKVLGVTELPSHTHSGAIKVSNVIADDDVAGSNVSIGASEIYVESAANTDLATGTVTLSDTGDGQAFDIRNPFLGSNYIIALEGIDPLA
ncbi:phage tail protein [Kordia aestuariivivens]|nr:tail fiber protein [Kordia aestuariivivens]